VIRAGYGLYRNTNVYQSIATLLAQQPPLSTTFNVATTAANPLTLADGFRPAPGATLNTFAVDPDFRVSSAQSWQLSVQRDLPASLTIAATYLGAKDSNLMQQFLPNTYPITDITIALELNYFQLNSAEYFGPIAVKIPGSELERARRRGAQRLTLDFLIEVKDLSSSRAASRPAASAPIRRPLRSRI
jgi:hypothetical protein